MTKKKFDFSGYATKVDLKCSDGRIIKKDAFKHNDGQTVPLVWQHLHNDPGNVLGHAILENREDGVYAYATFNETPAGKNAKILVSHGDITALSIHANQLQQKGTNVLHGEIREISLVMAGANPGALIDNLSIQHGDGSYEDDESEAIIYTGEPLSLEDIEHADAPADTATVQEVLDTLTDTQKEVVYAMIAHALEEGVTINQSADEEDTTLPDKTKEVKDDTSIDHSNEGGKEMKKNVFDQTTKTVEGSVLTHDQMSEILGDAKRCGSLKESFISHVATYGFDPINVLFPDAQNVNPGGPQTVQRDLTWVDVVLKETNHTPFSRIKTITSDLTADEARAKGYVTGNLKKEEIIPLMKRVTTPTTIYKKQKLDRDDMVDITDFDVVVWLKSEMRMMLDEELALAVLIGDGRDIASEDKINEQNIRPIMKDNDSVYTHRTILESTATTDDVIDEFIRDRKFYKGSGVPTLFTSTDLLTEMLLIKDTQGRRIYNNVMELASVLRVSKIIEVEQLNVASRKVDETHTNDILGVVVNLKDYTIGADKGGQVAMFDDFDIDYNQYKYLIETRVSGALTKPKSALIIERKRIAG